MKKIIYLANSRLPTEKAHGLEVMKLCEALSAHFWVELWTARRFNKIKEDPFEFYRLKRKFVLRRLPVIDTIPLSFFGMIGFWIEACAYSLAAFIYAYIFSEREDIFFSHENLPLGIVSIIRRNTFYDMHDFPVRGIWFYKILLLRVKGIIVTNHWKKEELARRFRIPPEKIVVQPNGVEIAEFDLKMTKEEARKTLALPDNTRVLVYTGQLFSWKGADTLAEAARLLDDTYCVYIVGGVGQDFEKFKEKYGAIKNLTMVGQRPHEEIPLWLKAADVLVLPNTAKEDISKYFTSPMKLFEYMASGTPIIASDLPSIRGVVDETMVRFFEPDNPRALAAAITDSINNSVESNNRSARARAEVERYTWKARAKKITKFIEERI